MVTSLVKPRTIQQEPGGLGDRLEGMKMRAEVAKHDYTRQVKAGCPQANWQYVDKATGEAADMDCKSWGCQVHGAMVAWRWSKRVLLSRYMGRKWTMMLTITQVPEMGKYGRQCWSTFIRDIRKAWKFRHFVRALESGDKTGMRHYHVLLDGVTWVPKSQLDYLAVKAGYGQVTWFSPISGGDRVKCVQYVVKYATKAGTKVALKRNERRVTTGRGSIASFAQLRTYWRIKRNNYEKGQYDTESDSNWTLARHGGMAGVDMRDLLLDQMDETRAKMYWG